MCGFTGFFDNNSNKREIIQCMTNSIVHRGPDGEGFFVDETIAMGFRRLSIIDLDHGHQPLLNEDKTLVLNFNGEIYNYHALREALLQRGHVFTTQSDSEVILHGYEEYGEDVVHHLRGMFAFVIYNTQTHTLFAARDPFGIKPFYYAQQDNLFCYASEIKAILKHPSFIKQLNHHALLPYLSFQTSVLDETFFKDVFVLKPGHILRYDNHHVSLKAYHELIFQPHQTFTHEEVLNLLKESVEAHKIADVEVGSFLSSGVDSSFIASLSDVDKTFTVGFEREGFNEGDDANALASLIQSEHHYKIINQDDFFNVLSDVQYYADEPHANLSAVPLYWLAQLASKHVKVVLSGEGADELFGGYDSYITTRKRQVANYCPHGLRGLIAQGLHHLSHVFPTLTSWEEAFRPISSTYIGQANIMNEKEAKRLLKTKYHSNLSNQSIVDEYGSKAKHEADVLYQMNVDMNVWLNKDILTKADKMTMAHSLELRVPFLDKHVWHCAQTMKMSQKIQGAKTKALFREVAEMVIPQAWAKRKKLGFMVPFRFWILEDEVKNKIETWFKKDFVGEFFHQDALLKLLHQHQKTQTEGRKIYTILCFLIWYDRYFVQEEMIS